MRASEFLTAKEGIAFLKFMIDKAWLTIKSEAEKQAEREENIRKEKKAKSKGKKPNNRTKPKKHIARPPKRKSSKPPTTKKMAKKKSQSKKKNDPRVGLAAKKPIPSKKTVKPLSFSTVTKKQITDKNTDYLDN